MCIFKKPSINSDSISIFFHCIGDKLEEKSHSQKEKFYLLEQKNKTKKKKFNESKTIVLILF